ncbi:PREDICTED: proton-coupled amino acid transporter 1-like [Papilio polytes]|uniref:proton-coupled amino acid transporter 1-like n=1 Tax=Papilio polytes TaxID=76194 RepID=UPI0006766114|nr:PREDICTED: proton-coupled amino acid transporter 1-like [Papilio polytes]
MGAITSFFFGDRTDTSKKSNQGPKFVIKSTPENAASYDFAAARPPGKKTNILESVGHLVKSCLGGGVVAIHESYKSCGLWTSMVLTIIMGFMISYSMYIIAKSAHKLYGRLHISQMSYPDVAEAAIAICPFPRMRRFSKCLRYAVDFTICVDLFGSCCVYQVVICRTIKQLVEGTDTVTLEGDPPLRAYVLMLLIPCIVICMITSLKYLAPFSIVADIFLLILAGATIYYGCKFSKVGIFEMPIFKGLPGLLEFLGVCVFSMEGVGVTMAIENNMKEPKKIGRVLLFGMSIVVGIVFVIGTFGYWGFGEHSKSPVTLNFPFTTFSITLKVFMAIIIYVTFALNFWVPFNLVWFYIKKKYPPVKYWFWERVYRASFIVVITLIAFTFPNVSSFIGLLGSFCLSNMGFIYPALIELCLDWDYPGLGFMKWRLLKCVLICIFGTFLGVFGTYTNAKELIRQSF